MFSLFGCQKDWSQQREWVSKENPSLLTTEMGTLTAASSVLPSDFKPSLSLSDHRGSLLDCTKIPKKRNRAMVPVSCFFFFIFFYFLKIYKKKKSQNCFLGFVCVCGWVILDKNG